MNVAREDLDRLAAELNDAATPPPPAERLPPSEPPAARDRGPLPAWLARVRECDGSDLLLVAGAAPAIRAMGKLRTADAAALDGGGSVEVDVIGSPAIGAFVAQFAFFVLIVWGTISSRLGLRGIVAAAIAWVAAFLFAGLFFSPAVAVLDIVLVFVTVGGDIRLT